MIVHRTEVEKDLKFKLTEQQWQEFTRHLQAGYSYVDLVIHWRATANKKDTRYEDALTELIKERKI